MQVGSMRERAGQRRVRVGAGERGAGRFVPSHASRQYARARGTAARAGRRRRARRRQVRTFSCKSAVCESARDSGACGSAPESAAQAGSYLLMQVGSMRERAGQRRVRVGAGERGAGRFVPSHASRQYARARGTAARAGRRRRARRRQVRTFSCKSAVCESARDSGACGSAPESAAQAGSYLLMQVGSMRERAGQRRVRVGAGERGAGRFVPSHASRQYARARGTAARAGRRRRARRRQVRTFSCKSAVCESARDSGACGSAPESAAQAGSYLLMQVGSMRERAGQRRVRVGAGERGAGRFVPSHASRQYARARGTAARAGRRRRARRRQVRTFSCKSAVCESARDSGACGSAPESAAQAGSYLLMQVGSMRERAGQRRVRVGAGERGAGRFVPSHASRQYARARGTAARAGRRRRARRRQVRTFSCKSAVCESARDSGACGSAPESAAQAGSYLLMQVGSMRERAGQRRVRVGAGERGAGRFVPSHASRQYARARGTAARAGRRRRARRRQVRTFSCKSAVCESARDSGACGSAPESAAQAGSYLLMQVGSMRERAGQRRVRVGAGERGAGRFVPSHASRQYARARGTAARAGRRRRARRRQVRTFSCKSAVCESARDSGACGSAPESAAQAGSYLLMQVGSMRERAGQRRVRVGAGERGAGRFVPSHASRQYARARGTAARAGRRRRARRRQVRTFSCKSAVCESARDSGACGSAPESAAQAGSYLLMQVGSMRERAGQRRVRVGAGERGAGRFVPSHASRQYARARGTAARAGRRRRARRRQVRTFSCKSAVCESARDSGACGSAPESAAQAGSYLLMQVGSMRERAGQRRVRVGAGERGAGRFVPSHASRQYARARGTAARAGRRRRARRRQVRTFSCKSAVCESARDSGACGSAPESAAQAGSYLLMQVGSMRERAGQRRVRVGAGERGAGRFVPSHASRQYARARGTAARAGRRRRARRRQVRTFSCKSAVCESARDSGACGSAPESAAQAGSYLLMQVGSMRERAGQRRVRVGAGERGAGRFVPSHASRQYARARGTAARAGRRRRARRRQVRTFSCKSAVCESARDSGACGSAPESAAQAGSYLLMQVGSMRERAGQRRVRVGAGERGAGRFVPSHASRQYARARGTAARAGRRRRARRRQVRTFSCKSAVCESARDSGACGSAPESAAQAGSYLLMQVGSMRERAGQRRVRVGAGERGAGRFVPSHASRQYARARGTAARAGRRRRARRRQVRTFSCKSAVCESARDSGACGSAPESAAQARAASCVRALSSRRSPASASHAPYMRRRHASRASMRVERSSNHWRRGE
uniref:Uncharacterized protein n=1 Tax=Heliothis virescens TaxID=7102 RepID=A0A2A4J1V1_HELVI